MSNRLAVIIVLVAGLLFVGSNSIYILNEMERVRSRRDRQ